MLLIALIVALFLERFLHIDSYICRFSWFESYVTFLQDKLGKTEILKGPLGLAIVVLPILIVVAIIYYLLCKLLWGFIGFLLAATILVYCFGPRDIYTRFENYFVALVRDDPELKLKAVKNLLCVVPEDPEQIPREITKSVFSHFNYSIFTVAFWFLFLGPLAAVLYRTIAEVHKYAHTRDDSFNSMQQSAAWAMSVIEWIPIRILALGFALMGDFQKSFSYWLKHVGSGLKENYKFIQQAGLIALGITRESDGTHDMAEIKSALHLIDRTLILLVVVAALGVLAKIVL